MALPRSSGTNLRAERKARALDREVAPIWHDRFGRMIARAIPPSPEAFVLEVNGRSGRMTSELLNRLDDGSRVFSLVADPTMAGIAKNRMRPEWKKRVYFKGGDFDEVLGMDDDTYDLSIANLVLSTEVPDWKAGLAELLRVTKPGGQVLATMAMRGSWGEVEELFEEVLRSEGMHEQVGTLRRVQKIRPRPQLIRRVLGELGLNEEDFVIEHQRFELLFPSGREFLFSPVVEYGPLPLWKAIIGDAKDPKKTFWRFMNAIDTYYRGHVLGVGVSAGLLRLRAPGGTPAGGPAEAFWNDFPGLHALWGGRPAPSGASSTTLGVFTDDDDFDLDIDIDMDVEEPEPEPEPKPEPKPKPKAAPAPPPKKAGAASLKERLAAQRAKRTPPPPPPSASSSSMRLKKTPTASRPPTPSRPPPPPPTGSHKIAPPKRATPVDLDAAVAAALKAEGFAGDDEDDDEFGDPDVIAAAIGDLLGESNSEPLADLEDMDDLDDMDESEFEELLADDDD